MVKLILKYMSFQNHLTSVKETSSLVNIFIFLGVKKELNQDSEITICIEDHIAFRIMHSGSLGRSHC
jgi:hypothetical protein